MKGGSGATEALRADAGADTDARRRNWGPRLAAADLAADSAAAAALGAQVVLEEHKELAGARPSEGEDQVAPWAGGACALGCSLVAPEDGCSSVRLRRIQRAGGRGGADCCCGAEGSHAKSCDFWAAPLAIDRDSLRKAETSGAELGRRRR